MESGGAAVRGARQGEARVDVLAQVADVSERHLANLEYGQGNASILVLLQVAGALEPDEFSLEKHRRIFGRMKDLYDRGERIDRVTLADELIRQGQLESVDGLAYLVSLDDGLPELANLDSYIRIVKDKAISDDTMPLLRQALEEFQRTVSYAS